MGSFRFRSPLLTESMSLSFPAGNEMFQFPAFARSPPMRSAGRDGRSCRRVSPFRDLRIDARLPAPRRFSQAAASFVASRCQDIHHAPLRAWPHLPVAGGKGVPNSMDTCRRRVPSFCFMRRNARPGTGQNYAKKVPDDACPNSTLKSVLPQTEKPVSLLALTY